jgi:sugar lactone lactonase YvrE
MYQRAIFAVRLPAPEGPVVGPSGWILNVCSFDPKDPDWPRAAGDITATHLSQPLVTHRVFNTSTDETVGIPAALAFGPDGCLYVTDEGRRSIVRVTPEGEKTDFISHYQGEKINGPNDLCFDEDGNLFFTDPWGSSLENPVGAVYGYEWETGTLYRIHSGLAFPNGILVGNGRVYAAETQTNKIWAYDVTGPGRAENPVEFCLLPEVNAGGGPDGMAFDAAGNIYIAQYKGGCIHVLNPEGELLESIPTSGHRPTNVCFGGPDFDALYATVDDLSAIETIHVGIEGYRLPFCPSATDSHPWGKMLPEVMQP